MAPRPPADIASLTGLRGIAALWVVLYHLTDRLRWPVFDAGWLGVDMFFTLSGFVLTHVYADRNMFTTWRSYVGFLMVRLARIYPLHIFALLVVAAVALLVPGYWPPGFAKYPLFGLHGLVEALLLVQNWPFIGLNNWHTPSWTLSNEWMAYLMFRNCSPHPHQSTLG